MKFQPTVLIDNAKCIQLQEGTLKLQCGQWIQLAWCDKPSRWIGLTKGGSIWAAHYPVKTDRFISMCQNINRPQTAK